MRLSKVRIQKYRSIRDTGWFDIESHKTIIVGPNESGKTAILEAIQHLNPPKGTREFEPLRDYPRSEFNDITTNKVDPKTITVVEGKFVLEDSEIKELPEAFRNCVYVFGRKLNNTTWHHLENGPEIPKFGIFKKDLIRLFGHIDERRQSTQAESTATFSTELEKFCHGWHENHIITGEEATKIGALLERALPSLDESNKTEETRYDTLMAIVSLAKDAIRVREILHKRLPVFVLFSNYFRVRPLIHLEHLATRIESNLLDDEYYDYGNKCLLQLLGFSARDLSELGKANEPAAGDSAALKRYRDQLDKRTYQLNAASVKLSEEIRSVWVPNAKRAEAERLRVTADGQYLKVVVEDELGVEIELDQRSEGFQWLVSFFIVFFAEAAEKHENAVLLLDEPGMSLHGIKQREFRHTISRLAETNQTIYTTHSPFLVGPNELDLVRVVEMIDRRAGTKVHTKVIANDPASLLPLQEALGYDLAQSLFAQEKNLILEGLTDYWYIDASNHLLKEAGIASLNEKIALIPANSAGKVTYFATILYAHKLKVTALLDSDTAGEQAAKQDTLVNTLGNKRILRTKDIYTGPVKAPEIEDILRTTLIHVAQTHFGWNIASTSKSQPERPIVDIFTSEIANFSKYKLAKAYIKWTQTHDANALQTQERDDLKKLINQINESLK